MVVRHVRARAHDDADLDLAPVRAGDRAGQPGEHDVEERAAARRQHERLVDAREALAHERGAELAQPVAPRADGGELVGGRAARDRALVPRRAEQAQARRADRAREVERRGGAADAGAPAGDAELDEHAEARADGCGGVGEPAGEQVDPVRGVDAQPHLVVAARGLGARQVVAQPRDVARVEQLVGEQHARHAPVAHRAQLGRRRDRRAPRPGRGLARVERARHRRLHVRRVLDPALGAHARDGADVVVERRVVEREQRPGERGVGDARRAREHVRDGGPGREPQPLGPRPDDVARPGAVGCGPRGVVRRAGHGVLLGDGALVLDGCRGRLTPPVCPGAAGGPGARR